MYHQCIWMLRQFNRYRSTFMINLLGLTLGLTSVLLIFLWVRNEYGMDRFHEKNARLYEVMANHDEGGNIRTIHETPDQLAEALAAEIPEVEMATNYMPAHMIPMKFILENSAGKKMKGAGQFSDKRFFEVFSYPLLEGNPAQVLQSPNSLVISESLAKDLFGSPSAAMGQAIRWQLAKWQRDAVVSGVFKQLPENSSERFDFLITNDIFHDPTLFKRRQHWDNHAPSTFVVLRPGADAAAVNDKIAGFIKNKLASSRVTLFLQPYADCYLYNAYENGQIAGGRIQYVRLFSLVALFILLIACINFMNLATARASLRMKEIGIKKAIGISRGRLALQFLGESVFLSAVALLCATLLVWALLPQFNVITDKQIQLGADYGWAPGFVGIALLTGILAGAYPALYLSGFKPMAMLRGKTGRRPAEAFARKGLVVLQFAMSVVFIIAVTVVYQQIQLVQHKNLGYNREQIIYFGREGALDNGMERFITDLKTLPGVEQAAGLSGVFIGEGSSFTTGINWPGKSESDNTSFAHLSGTIDLIQTLGIQPVEGRLFSRDFPSDSMGLIFNETAIRHMGLKQPIGQVVQMWGENRQIIGVVKDFHLKSLREPIQPAFFRINNQDVTDIMVQIRPGRERETVAQVQEKYSQINPGYTFEFRFLDADYQRLYQSEFRISALAGYAALLAIVLSCMGLFGLAAFTAEQRTKEIGVRKVLGATAAGIVRLLARDFLKLVLLAIVLAVPVSYWLMQRWLAAFAYRVELSTWVFVLAGVAAVVVAGLTVSAQSLRAALANPVKSLRDM
jgi:putative ABC transport system permease protein